MVRRLLIVLALLSASFAHGQERLRDLIYHKQAGSAFTMDVFKPAKPNGSAIIWIVSGGWFSTHESINAELPKAFNDRGITVIQAVHGSQPKFTVPEILGQLRQAIRFTRANASKFGIDPNRIGVAGASAGGHLSLMLAATPAPADANSSNPLNKFGSEVQAVVAYFPPTDFANWGKPDYLAIEEKNLAIFMPALGVTPTTPKDQLAKVAQTLSPITYVNAKFPPTLLIHGDADKLVPVQQSQVLNAAFAKAGAVHDLMVIPGAGHDASVMAPSAVRVLEWFEKHLAKRG
jgi:acetyl esterase/lipase